MFVPKIVNQILFLNTELVLIFFRAFSFFLSFPGWGEGRSLPQETPEALWIGHAFVSRLSIPSGPVVGCTVKHQILHCFIHTIAVWIFLSLPALAAGTTSARSLLAT